MTQTDEIALHSSLPWVSKAPYAEIVAADGSLVIEDAFGFQGDYKVQLANAAFICRACNSHDALVAALRMVVGYLRAAEHWPRKADHMGLLQDAEQALALAEGR